MPGFTFGSTNLHCASVFKFGKCQIENHVVRGIAMKKKPRKKFKLHVIDRKQNIFSPRCIKTKDFIP